MNKTRLYPRDLVAEYEARVKAVAEVMPLKSRYKKLNVILCEVLQLLTADVPYVLAGAYAQMEYVIGNVEGGYSGALRRLRMKCRYCEKLEAELGEDVEGDMWAMRALLEIMATGTATGYEGSWRRGGKRLGARKSGNAYRIMKVCVTEGGNLSCVTVEEVDGEESMTLDLSEFGYMEGWLKKGTMLGLVYYGEKLNFVVYEPDYLVDSTTVASCFAPTTNDYRMSFINKWGPDTVTEHIIMGNMASLFLDEGLVAMRHGAEPTENYGRSARLFFRSNALSLATTDGIDEKWHEEAKQQQRNVNEALKTMAAEGILDVQKALTEVSLLGASIGFQGRADLMQTDWKMILEQKSGKKDYYTNGAKLEHYVQLLIYMMMMDICYGKRDDVKDAYFFLYSKYKVREGLLRGGSKWSETMGRTIMEMRNEIVRAQMRFMNRKALEEELMSWSVNEFRKKRVSDNLWDRYVGPKIGDFLNSIKNAKSVERAYVMEMLSFLQREDIIGRLGGAMHGREGFASVWTMAAEQRKEAGECVMKLEYRKLDRDEEDALYDTDEGSIVVLFAPKEDDEATTMPNFRKGDSVMIYDYEEGGEPDVRAALVIKSTLLDVMAGEDGTTYRVKMRRPMPRNYFESAGRIWVMEHDMSASTNARLSRQVMSFLWTTEERKQLVLAERNPKVDTGVERLIDHGVMNEMVEREMAAKDLFLLVGPPGTGKTSFGLMSILREELAHEGHAVLLLSYTNRAVDEICSKLEKDGLEYLRIGPMYSCDEKYWGRLLSMIEFRNVREVREKLRDARIIVGTTSSIGCATGLFKVKRFDLAIVDEASQILEPSILGIMSAVTETGYSESVPSVGRFVLIGDERQLPAVVQQRRKQSIVVDKELRATGLVDTRESFFGRMIRRYGNDASLVYRLTRHGRMHPEVAAFCNKHFYGGTLKAIPLDHQKCALDLKPDAYRDNLQRELASRRTMFIDSHSNKEEAGGNAVDEQGKVNMKEAKIVARVAKEVMIVWRNAGKKLEADTTLGIVVPYRNQITAIRGQLLLLTFGDAELTAMARDMTIDTVERLQGSEREIVIYGFTVSSFGQLEFLKESQYVEADGTIVDRKLNVALSRAREQLIVIGDKRTIGSVKLYADLVSELGEVECG